MAQVLKSKNGQKWIVRFYYKGVKYSVQNPTKIGYEDEYWSTASITENKMKKLAPIVEDKYIQYLKQEKENQKTCNMVLGRVVQDFLNYESTIVNYSTYTNYKAHLKIFVNYFGKETQLKECVTAESLMKFRNYLSSLNDKEEASKNNILLKVRNFLEYLAVQEIISYDQLGKAKNILVKFRVSKKLVREEDYWTPEEFDNFISAFDDSKPRDYLYKTVYLVAYWCGLRLGELGGLKYSDFDIQNKTVLIQRQRTHYGKIAELKTNSSYGKVNVRSEVIDRIVKLNEMEVGEEYLFPVSRGSIEKNFKKYTNQVGNKEIVFHGLRRSIASRMIQSGVNILYVSKHLRHESPDVTMHSYASLFPTTNKDIINQL